MSKSTTSIEYEIHRLPPRAKDPEAWGCEISELRREDHARRELVRCKTAEPKAKFRIVRHVTETTILTETNPESHE